MQNDYEANTLKLGKGVIAMARGGSYSQYAQFFGKELIKADYNSAGSQFFIMTTDDNTALTGLYAGFGKVIEGCFKLCSEIVQAVAKSVDILEIAVKIHFCK